MMHRRHFDLPKHAITIIYAFLGDSYWIDRERLSILNLRIDFVSCNIFNSWITECKWRSWYKRHPELNTHTEFNTFPWKQLPSRLFLELENRLKSLKLQLLHILSMEDDMQAAAIQHLMKSEAVQWYLEADQLRKRVHFGG